MWSNADYAGQSNPQVAETPVHDQARVAPLTPTTALAVMPPPGPPGAAPLTPSALDGSFDVPPTLHERIELCKFLAEANLLPGALRQAPANVLLIMHKAMALGIPLTVAIEHLHVIDGKVGHSAELLRALLHRHGHILRWPSKDDKEVVGELTLRHDPRNPRRERFTIADAARMELTSKPNWKKDPESMMVARCTTRLVSRHCPEVAVALGNLSAIDFDDDDIAASEAVQATAEVVGQSPQDQAAELYREAQTADTSDVLKDIGARAREAKLLEQPVDGDTTLQNALLHRINEIAQAREGKPAADTPHAAAAAEAKGERGAGQKPPPNRSPRGSAG